MVSCASLDAGRLTLPRTTSRLVQRIIATIDASDQFKHETATLPAAQGSSRSPH